MTNTGIKGDNFFGNCRIEKEQVTLPLGFLFVLILSQESEESSSALITASFRQKMLASCSGEFCRSSWGRKYVVQMFLSVFHALEKSSFCRYICPTFIFINSIR